jgi:hypothetical protein
VPRMLTPEQRRWRADKVGDLANIAIGALLFGQFTTAIFRIDLAVLGLTILLLGFAYSNYLLKNLH